MAIIDVIGILASVCVLAGFVPQIWRAYKTRKMGDVSYFLMGLIGFGMLLWMFYGLMRNDWIIFGSNVIGVIFNVTLILMKWRYGKR